MIYFITASRSYLYPKPQRASKKIIINYLFPEAALTELEMKEFVNSVVGEHTSIYKPLKYSVTVFSNSGVIFGWFRVAIKEGRLHPDDFKIKFYNDNPRYGVKCLDLFLDKDGRHDWKPEDFFDGVSNYLRRLI